MECVVYLFPESDSLPMARCSTVLVPKRDLSLEERAQAIDGILATHQSAIGLSCYYKGLYFQENVRSFLASYDRAGYPRRMNLIRSKIKGSSILSAERVFDKPLVTKATLFGAPTSTDDYFVVAAWHAVSTHDSVVYVGLLNGENRVVDVCFDDTSISVQVLPNSIRTLWDWLSQNHSPARVYENNPKHIFEHWEMRGLASKWPFDQDSSQHFLDKAIPQGKRLVFYDEETDRFLVFPCHDNLKNLFHAFPEDASRISNDVKKLLRMLGVMR